MALGYRDMELGNCPWSVLEVNIFTAIVKCIYMNINVWTLSIMCAISSDWYHMSVHFPSLIWRKRGFGSLHVHVHYMNNMCKRCKICTSTYSFSYCSWSADLFSYDRDITINYCGWNESRHLDYSRILSLIPITTWNQDILLLPWESRLETSRNMYIICICMCAETSKCYTLTSVFLAR